MSTGGAGCRIPPEARPLSKRPRGWLTDSAICRVKSVPRRCAGSAACTPVDLASHRCRLASPCPTIDRRRWGDVDPVEYGATRVPGATRPPQVEADAPAEGDR